MAFTASDCYRLKLLRILETAGEQVLTYGLQCGMVGKSPAVPLDQYLKTLPPSSTCNFIKLVHKKMKKSPKTMTDAAMAVIGDQLTPTDMAQIHHDPSCATFDITLLYKIIKLACENVAEMYDTKWKDPMSDEFEAMMTKIKEDRNEVVHEKKKLARHEFLTRVAELRATLYYALEATRLRYNRNHAEMITERDKVMSLVDAIMRENLSNQEILQHSANTLLPLFRVETDRELKAKLQNAKNLSPLHFLTGHRNMQVDVENVFTKIAIAEEKADRHSNSTRSYADYLKLLKYGCQHQQPAGQGQGQGGARPRNTPPPPRMLLVEGDAGGGKTTLLTFVLSEWLKEACHRHFEGLHDYDLLLWVVCREQSSASLEDFVVKLLPEADEKYGQLLLSLLKQCRVLVLIDGIDERNVASRRLVADVLSHGCSWSSFTAVCTSRPESVLDMVANTPQVFHVHRFKMLGISPEERMEFVLKHYRWLAGGAADTAHLRHLMQQIGWKELFRLPLNLVFLSTLYYHNPNNVTHTIKQSELYHFIHTWSVEKLHHRLATHTHTHTRVFRQQRIERVLGVVRKIALQGLLRGLVYLSGEDQNLLHVSCSSEGLPQQEVMQAFYSLRREVSFGMATEYYSAPHKGLQEFFAAQHIIGCLQNYRRRDIRRTLKDAVPGQTVQLAPLRNMFCHVLGLLSRQSAPGAAAMEEAVDLIQESGVKTTEEWLALLADSEAPPAAIRRVAHHINNEPDQVIIVVKDGTVDIAKELLPLTPPVKVEVWLSREIGNTQDLLPALAHHALTNLWLFHHYKHPTSLTSEHLLRLLPRDHLQLFMGYLDAGHLSLLPTILSELFLVVADDDHARRLLPALTQACTSLPQLFNLTLHVPVLTVRPEALAPLPAVQDVYLTLSGVHTGNLEAAWRIAEVCYCGNEGYAAITFREVSLAFDRWTRLFLALKAAGVVVRDAIQVPKADVTEEDMVDLRQLGTSLLGCRVVRIEEEYLY